MTAQQSSKLLADLFAKIDEEQRITVLHIGPALPETVDFFSRYRCKLHFLDLFCELPFAVDDPEQPDARRRFSELLAFPADTRFDLCLFWDVFNYLDAASITAFLDALRPWLRQGSQAHGFAVHNPRTASPRSEVFAIGELDELIVRPRRERLPGYAPHPQSRLQVLLNCFRFDRTVLLADSRLELLLSAAFQGAPE